MRTLLGFCLLFFFSIPLFATHIEAGEITYRKLSGTTYEATVVFYVKKASEVPGGTIEGFSWGDGKSETLTITSETQLPDGATLKRVYIAKHTYDGPGIFKLSIVGNKRIGGVVNLRPGLDNGFYLESDLIVNPFNSGFNNSPILYNPPLDQACFGQIYEHNPMAIDPDGDLLTYELVACRGEGAGSIEYVSPDSKNPGANNSISINYVTGTVHWESPQLNGIYNIAILITEYRNGEKVGSVLRDMQIVVDKCSNNPAQINIADIETCVKANTTFTQDISASDPVSASDVITMVADGDPFRFAQLKASFNSNVSGNPATAQFSWNTTCKDVREERFQVIIKATGTGNPRPTDYSTIRIKVIAPPVAGVTATSLDKGAKVSWAPSTCTNASCYKIYRVDDVNLSPGPCETGFDGDLIGTVDGLNTTNYIDTSALYLSKFCYRIVACFPDGSESQFSERACIEPLFRLMKASVGVTNTNKGVDTVIYTMPLGIDTNINAGPYQFKVHRIANIIDNSETLVYSSPLEPAFSKLDTVYLDSLFNTNDSIHTYRVEFFSNGVKAGSTPNGSTVFLKVIPADKRDTLHWTSRTPWINTQAIIQRKDLAGFWANIDSLGFDSIKPYDTTYTDENLINGQQYCYRVITIGNLRDPRYPKDCINFSQEVCQAPVDKEAPCTGNIQYSATGFCEQEYVEILWDNKLKLCSNDIRTWDLFYSPTKDGVMSVIKSFPPSVSQYIYKGEFGSIAGCYAIGATDSIGNRTIADSLRMVCIENCPDYLLPNVFTPNGDGQNDFFVPFPYHGIEKVDCKIFNRWGKLVFETTDPAIKWDGKAAGKPVPDGVYFYVVEVTKIKLTGNVVESLKGSVTIFTGDKKTE